MATITVGNDPSVGSYTAQSLPGYTELATGSNPACSGDGQLTTFKIYFGALGGAAAGVKIGTFYQVSGYQYAGRDLENIGAVANGSVQTFSGKYCDAEAGDVIGYYCSSGRLAYAATAGYGSLYDTGDFFETTHTYTYYNGVKYALYGEGTEATPGETIISRGEYIVDFTAAGAAVYCSQADLSGYVGYQIVVEDLSGNQLTGYGHQAGSAVSLGSELIPTNEGMEDGFTGGIADDWDIKDGTSSDETTIVNSGSHSQKISCGVSEKGYMQRYDIPITYGQAYRYEDNIYSSSGNLGLYHVVRGYGGGDYTVSLNAVASDVSGAWTQKVYNFSGRVTDAASRIYFGRLSPVSGYTFYFDDISVKAYTNLGTGALEIRTTAGGSTRGWAIIDAGFDPGASGDNIAHITITALAEEVDAGPAQTSFSGVVPGVFYAVAPVLAQASFSGIVPGVACTVSPASSQISFSGIVPGVFGLVSSTPSQASFAGAIPIIPITVTTPASMASFAAQAAGFGIGPLAATASFSGTTPGLYSIIIKDIVEKCSRIKQSADLISLIRME